MTVRLGAIDLGGLGSLELGLYSELDDVEILAGADVSEGARENFEDEHGAPAYDDYAAMLDAHDLTRGDRRRTGPGPTGGLPAPLRLAVPELKRVVGSGRIGDVHAANAFLGQDWIELQRGTSRTASDLSGDGQLYDSGSHLLDALLWTLEATPRTVAEVTDSRGEVVDVNSALAATLDREREDGTSDTVSVASASSATARTANPTSRWSSGGPTVASSTSTAASRASRTARPTRVESRVPATSRR